MNNVLDFNKCANCGACQNICPKDAIFVKKEDLFYKVDVNSDLCISCGLCKKVCPVNEPQVAQELSGAYSVINKNSKVVKQSSSGGFFSALAEYVIKQNGIVFAAAYSGDFTEVIYTNSDVASLDSLRRSKYVESLVELSFREIRKNLEENRLVLFCGAPCQVAGLRRFLGSDYENLITCDFSCGGFPSHKIFQNYLKELTKKFNCKSIEEVNFRPKDYGWTIHSIRVKFKKGKVYRGLLSTDPYFHSFISSGLSKREYCYNCSFSDNHYADFILADFWKYASFDGFSRNDKGISLILTNSKKAELFLQNVNNSLDIKQLDLNLAAYNIKKSTTSDKKMLDREKFLIDFENSGIFEAAKFQGLLVDSDAFKAYCRARVSQLKNKVKTILRKK